MSEAADAATGKHAVVANFTDAASQAAVVDYIQRGNRGNGKTPAAFPRVTVTHPDADAVVSDVDGGDVVQVTAAVVA